MVNATGPITPEPDVSAGLVTRTTFGERVVMRDTRVLSDVELSRLLHFPQSEVVFSTNLDIQSATRGFTIGIKITRSEKGVFTFEFRSNNSDRVYYYTYGLYNLYARDLNNTPKLFDLHTLVDDDFDVVNGLSEPCMFEGYEVVDEIITSTLCLVYNVILTESVICDQFSSIGYEHMWSHPIGDVCTSNMYCKQCVCQCVSVLLWKSACQSPDCECVAYDYCYPSGRSDFLNNCDSNRDLDEMDNEWRTIMRRTAISVFEDKYGCDDDSYLDDEDPRDVIEENIARWISGEFTDDYDPHDYSDYDSEPQPMVYN